MGCYAEEQMHGMVFHPDELAPMFTKKDLTTDSSTNLCYNIKFLLESK